MLFPGSKTGNARMTVGRVLLAIASLIIPCQLKMEQNVTNLDLINVTNDLINGTNVTDFELFDFDTRTDPLSIVYNFSNPIFELTTIEFVDKVTKRSSEGKIDAKPDLYKNWPVKHAAEVPGDLILGGLMMIHEREDSVTCGPIMPQGGVQALETMLFTLDEINNRLKLLPNLTIGAHILDDCDKDTYGLEMAVDFIKGRFLNFFIAILRNFLAQLQIQ